ncbi:MAG: 16S rRNA (cytidine(1402)-2'-O)-methyltransferase [Dehalococcoidia bacterium]|nr:16S rRNA (cytidine(1402)-2'-O)-methyltransferase [Dehalococcoidia bacterium]
MAALYVVATPIGNLEDITLRALRILREADLIAAEDTRKTRRLLSAYDIHTPLTSFHAHSGKGKVEQILRVLAEDKAVALVSEAGTPGINDPGYPLIKAAIEEGINIIPVPGPSAPIAALAVSGLTTHRFIYLGFLPRKKGERRKVLASNCEDAGTLVLLESPHRLIKSLEDILDVLGDRRIAVCREMTKIYEEVYRGRVSEAMEHFKQPRGEFTLVVEGVVERA